MSKDLDKLISEEEWDNLQSTEYRLTKMISPDMIDVHPSAFDSSNVKGAISKYSHHDKIYACIVHTVTGSLSKTQYLTHIPSGTISAWKETPWWATVREQVQKIRNEFLDAQLTQIAEEATRQMLDRIQNGDEVYNHLTGEKIRIPVKFSDLSNSGLKTALEKREELRGGVVAGKEKSSVVEHLKRLADAFESVVRAPEVRRIEDATNPPNVKTIDAEVTIVESET